MNQLSWLKYFKDLKPDHSFLSWLAKYFNPNTMVFQFEDSEVTPTYEEMCAVMDHHPEQARLIPTYGPAYFRSRSQGHFDFGDNPVIRSTCPWWRISLFAAGSMNLNYVLYTSLDRSMAYFPDKISRQYGMIQRVPRIHDFESGPMMQSLLINLADRWRNRNTWYLGQGVMQDTVTPGYVNWFYTP
ncbi:hypothetical protein JCGZ_16938 [Jatropha curcas]|uniref:Aminotransferase-like plant mobile domain-containing protein n=1 Tax=Jatropha curcas TaxID=180498 RepID=A0A067K390_JATCU|nr:hypothetical protein JCGZ_16938 [Jatropha curcas]